MKPEALQTFYQAIKLAETGQKEAAHHLMKQLAVSYPDDPKLLLWLIYTSTELMEAQGYLIKLAGIDLDDPNLPRARAWVNSPESNLRLPVASATARTNNIAGYSEGFGGETVLNYDPLANYSVKQPAGWPLTMSAARLLSFNRQVDTEGLSIWWSVELEDGEHNILYRANNTTKAVFVDRQLIERYYPQGKEASDYESEYHFRIGRYECLIKHLQTVQEMSQQILIINNVRVESHEFPDITIKPKPKTPILFYIIAIFSILVINQIYHFAIIPGAISGAGCSLAVTIGRGGKTTIWRVLAAIGVCILTLLLMLLIIPPVVRFR